MPRISPASTSFFLVLAVARLTHIAAFHPAHEIAAIIPAAHLLEQVTADGRHVA